MENTTCSRAQQTSDRDALFLASLVLLDVKRTVAGIQTIVAFLLRYATLAASITDGLVGLSVPSVSAEK